LKSLWRNVDRSELRSPDPGTTTHRTEGRRRRSRGMRDSRAQTAWRTHRRPRVRPRPGPPNKSLASGSRQQPRAKPRQNPGGWPSGRRLGPAARLRRRGRRRLRWRLPLGRGPRPRRRHHHRRPLVLGILVGLDVVVFVVVPGRRLYVAIRERGERPKAH